MRDLVGFLLHIRTVYSRWKAERCREAKLSEIRNVFDRNDFGSRHVHPNGTHPLYAIGLALKLAREYNIELWQGLAYSDCRAVLPESAWKNMIDPTVNQFSYGAFTVRPVDEITDIVGFGESIGEAVCVCLNNAKTAGVL